MNDVGRQGFTLVELAVSMVVIGILLGMGMSMVGPLMTSIKVRESKENLAASVESVNSYASGNNRLPDTTSAPATNPNLLANVVKASADAWGRNFIYLYDTNLAPATATKDTICGRRSTFITLTDTNTGAVIPNVAYLMLSQADDAATNSTIGGVAVTTGPRAAATAVTVDTVNDLVRWVTLDELRTKVGCQGAQLKIVNNELPFGAVPNAYSVTIMADGGVPFAVPNTYRWCVSPSPLPSGFTQIGGVVNADCLSLAENSWAAAAPGLTVSFPANTTTTGAYQITVVARDAADGVATSNACNNASPGDNCAQKVFVVTVNPS